MAENSPRHGGHTPAAAFVRIRVFPLRAALPSPPDAVSQVWRRSYGKPGRGSDLGTRITERVTRAGPSAASVLPLAGPPQRHRRWSEPSPLPGSPPLAPHRGRGAAVFGAFLGLPPHPHD